MSKKVITFYDSEKQSHDFPIITPDYGVCGTSSNISAKVVTCDDFSLFTGAEITVKFTNTPTTDTITLNVNDSGAINVDFSTCGNKPSDEIKANGCYGFVYDGTSWIYKGSGSGSSKEELERLQYYEDKNITPSPESYFTVNATGETITGLTNTGKTQTELVIPYKINGITITTLLGEYRADVPDWQSILDGNSVITKVILPNSITSIGNYAFQNCELLTSINIPSSVTSIGSSVFWNCTSLTSINIPNGVTSIEQHTFENCTALKSIDIPNDVTSIDIQAFARCDSLEKVEIPNSVTSINIYAFEDCTNLKIYCEQGSYAETYAKTNGIPIVYTNVKDIVSSTNVLTKTNTTEFTPSTDYQPATKKYVDDAINTSSSGEVTNVSSVKSCTGDELIAITSPTMGSIRYVSIAGTGDNVSITPGLYFYLDSWKKVAIEDTAIISNEFVSGGDSTSINN